MGYPVWKSLGTILGIIVVVVGAILGFYVVPKKIEDEVDNTVKLINGSDTFERWKMTPIPLDLKVYFFNISNPNDVKNGFIPIVKEVGPYVYKEKAYKVRITEEDDTLSYDQKYRLFFNEEASNGKKEDDTVTIANLPLMVFLTIVEKKSQSSAILNRVLNDIFENSNDLFLTTKVKDVLFEGIFLHCNKTNVRFQNLYNTVCDSIRDTASKQLEEISKGFFKFSFLSFKNDTDFEKRFKINSGIKDIELLGDILEWGNSSKLNIWKKDGTCNDLHGSDAMIFPPRRTSKSQINVFISDICRVINFHYKAETKYQGLSTITFVVEDDVLVSGKTLEKNKCYCLNETTGITSNDGCLLDGAMELYSCLNSPIVMTLPHFVGAHSIYRNGVKGMKPNATLHRPFAELEPNTGFVIRGSKRAQFNIFYRHIKGFKITKNLTATLMPVIWLDEGAQLSDELVKKLDDEFFSVIKTINIVKWIVIGVGAVLSLISVISFFIV